VQQDLSQWKMISLKEVIHIRRVVDSHLYGSRQIFIRRSKRSTKFVDEIRDKKLSASMSTYRSEEDMVMKLMNPEAKYRIVY
jgi:hypothetical protein